MLTEVLRRAFGDDPFTASEAAAVLGIKSPSSTLYRLKAAGVLERVGRGKYRFAPLGTWQRLDSALAQETIRTSRAERGRDLAELATKRFASWLETGYLTKLGPRRYRLRVSSGGRPLSVRRK